MEFYLLTVKTSSSCLWNVAGTLSCIQNLGSGCVYGYLCFSVWESLLSVMIVIARAELLESWRRCTQRSGFFVFAWSSEMQLCLWGRHRVNKKGAKPSGIIWGHTSRRPDTSWSGISQFETLPDLLSEPSYWFSCRVIGAGGSWSPHLWSPSALFKDLEGRCFNAHRTTNWFSKVAHSVLCVCSTLCWRLLLDPDSNGSQHLWKLV